VSLFFFGGRFKSSETLCDSTMEKEADNPSQAAEDEVEGVEEEGLVRRMTRLGVFRRKEKRLAELDWRINRVLQREFGIASTEELVRVAGADAFGSDGAVLPSELRVMDAGEFLNRVRGRQQDAHEYAQTIARLTARLRQAEAELADTENTSPEEAAEGGGGHNNNKKKGRGRLTSEASALRREIHEYELMRRYARLELWQLSREEDTRVVDMDAVRARLDALVERRLQLALQLRVAEAERICAERAAMRTCA